MLEGRRIGPYELSARIGAGGMGEVYKAVDTRLNRTVAIKVLPAHVAADPQARERFEREARAVAALNHPHICTLHDVGSQDGIDFLVMEFVEGETLAARLQKGPLGVARAIEYGIQIASALDAAHRAGIVHRDLKPGNIMIVKSGAKLLDFGLAKTWTPSTAPLPNTHAITTPPLTSPGMLIGTVQYMAPEQVEGRPVDTRTDIFAFGVVLYEMVAGRTPFDAESSAGTIAAILERAPRSLSSIQPSTPLALDRLVATCLAKDPDDRWQSVRDVMRELQWLTAEEQPGVAAVGGVRTGIRWRRTLPWALMAIAGALALLLSLRITPGLPISPVTRLELNLPPGVELYTASGRGVCLSPDGVQVAFVGMGSVLRQIYVRRLDALDAIPLRGTDTATACFFSPDGRSIGFLSSASVLSKVSLADGLVSTIAPDVSALYGGAWGADDRIVFVRSGSLWQVPAAGGTPKRLTTLDAERHETYHAWPAVLPGGHAILFTSANTDISGGAATARIEALTLATGERRVLVEQGTFAMYAANGRLAYFRNGELLAAPFDAAGLQLTGPAARVVERLPVGSAGTPVMDLSAAGTLVYAPTTAAGRLVWVSREGLEQPLNDVVRNYASPRVSRDGSRIIVQAGDLWIQDLVRGTFTRLTEAAPTSYPAWTPDARRIVFRVTGGLRWLDVDGSGRSGLIPETSEADFPLSISPDGETLLVSRNSPEMSIDIYRFSLNGAPTPVPIVKTPAYESGASFSPDGQWVAYVSNESGRMEVYVRRLSGLDRKWQVSIAGGNQPHWNPNGKEIVYRNGSKMMAVGVSTSPELTLSQPRLLFDQPYATGTGITIRNYDLAPDGRFVMVKTESTAARLIVISNWLSELTRLVPAQ